MSWDSYIDNLKDHCGGACDLAAIIGKDGSIWTTTAGGSGIDVSAAEAATIGGAYTAKDFTAFQAGGIVVGGVKYKFLREDEELVLGKLKDHGAITMKSTKTAVVIGHTAEGQQQGNTNKGVGVITEYLESLDM